MENPFAKPPAPSVEREPRSEAEILAEVAKTHLDDILPAEEWKRLGLDAVSPYTPDEDFQWSVYVIQAEHGKSIGVKIFTEAGMSDVQEFACPDPSLPISTRQDAVDAETARRGAAAWAKEEEEMRVRRAAAEAMRGFPDGAYAVKVSYPHRKGGWRTVSAGRVHVGIDDTRAAAIAEARAWVQMEGLHNFGLAVPSQDGVEVEAWMENDDGVKVAFPCRLDASGHLVG